PDVPCGDVWLLRFNYQGEILWQVAMGGDEHDDALAIAVLTQGGVVLAGASQREGSQQPWVARVDAEGTILWQQRFTNAGTGQATGVVAAESGICVGGYVGIGSAGDGWIVNLNWNGQIVWQKLLGGA